MEEGGIERQTKGKEEKGGEEGKVSSPQLILSSNRDHSLLPDKVDSQYHLRLRKHNRQLIPVRQQFHCTLYIYKHCY